VNVTIFNELVGILLVLLLYIIDLCADHGSYKVSFSSSAAFNTFQPDIKLNISLL
jgi:hypothetical protein